jgi:hypothetical protein
MLAFDLDLLKEPEFKVLSKEVTEIQQMLAGFLKKLRADR